MSGHRQAAAALHGLTRHDQRLILAELPRSDRKVLQDYLHELDTLGFDGSAVQATEVAPQAASNVADPPREKSAIETVRAASAAAMSEVFAYEPAALVGQFLSIEAWPWAADFLDSLPIARGTQVRAAFNPAIAPARARCLLEAAASMLAAAPAAIEMSYWRTLTARVGAWTR